MSSIESACRVCLARGGTRAIEDEQLQETFDELTKSLNVSNNDLPKNLCCVCFSQLQRCHRFRNAARRSGQILFDILSSNKVTDNTTILQDPGATQNFLSRSAVWIISTDDPLSTTTEIHNGYSYTCVFEGTMSLKQEVKQETLQDEIFINIDKDMTNSEERSLDEEQILTKTRRNSDKNYRKINKVTRDVFKCTFCTKTFNYSGHLNRHMRSHIKSYVCDRCSKKFKLKSAFEAHMRTHTGEKPFACEICGKTFNQKSHLKTHIQTHTGFKPFSCEKCAKSFRQRAQLISHLRTHTGERPFACNHCEMSFGHLTTLRKHKRLHIEVKTFACTLCPISFEQESSLAGHLRVHTALRPHICQKCNKSFLEARHLKEHVYSVHSMERPYSCDRCGKRFKRAEHLKHHARLAKCVQTPS